MVQHGEITPAYAESQAQQLGFGALASEPDPNDYDPMREPFWTLPMAVAWIAYRTPDAVRNWWGEYRQKFTVWRFREWRVGQDGPVHQRHFLEERPNATLSRLHMVGAKRDQADPMSVEEAINAFWLAAQSGRLEVTGIDENAGRRVPIPAQEWHDLTWFEEKGRDATEASRSWAIASPGMAM